MSTPAMTTREPDLAEVAAWRLISLLFEYPRSGWGDLVATLGREVKDADLRAAAEAAVTEASPGTHQSLFGPGGPVPPREVTYLGGAQCGYLLAELTAFYEVFGYRPHLEEAVDHVATESGFVAYLALKEAYALLSGDEQAASVTAEAADRFRADHLAVMAEPIAVSLEAGGPPYLALAARALLRRVGPAPARPLAMVDVSPGADDHDSVECGGGPGPSIA